MEFRREKNRAAKNTRSSVSSKSFTRYNFTDELVNHTETQIEEQIELLSGYITLHVSEQKLHELSHLDTSYYWWKRCLSLPSKDMNYLHKDKWRHYIG